MKVIFDLDGTLIDSSERMYRLFQELVPQSAFSKEEYWEFKRNKVNHKQLLERFFPEVNYECFNDAWLLSIENDFYLNMDVVFPDTIETLIQLSGRSDVFLLTARQSKSGLERELNRLQLKDFFAEVITTEGKMTKESLLKQYLTQHPGFADRNDYFVSDVGRDIVLGKECGYKTVAITHGFMNEEKLIGYYPDLIINELRELPKHLVSNLE